MENDFVHIKKWFSSNVLTINYSKTTFLTFSSYPRITFDSVVIVNDHEVCEIKSSESVKYLGVIVDKHLKWDIHSNNVVRRLRGLLPRFREMKQYLDFGRLKTLYYSLVQSHLTYGIIAWGGAYKNSLRNLEVIQKYFLKLLLNKPKTHPTDQVYREADVFDLRQLYSYSVIIKQFVHSEHISLLEHTYDTRQQKTHCRTTRCNKSIGQRCYTYLGQKLYNILPSQIKTIVSLTLFKKQVKNWLSSLPRKYIHEIIEVRME